jgi:hypothetical protein
MIPNVDRPGQIVVTLRLTAGAEPIAGELDRDGRVDAFTGWLELTRALERALAGETGCSDRP